MGGGGVDNCSLLEYLQYIAVNLCYTSVPSRNTDKTPSLTTFSRDCVHSPIPTVTLNIVTYMLTDGLNLLNKNSHQSNQIGSSE